MESGDGMGNGDADSAVRILPNEASTPAPSVAPGTVLRRRLFLPVLVVLGVVAVFVVATRPGAPLPTTTTPPPARIADIDATLIDLRTSSTAPIANEWASTFEWNGEINDVVRASSSFVAVGSTDRGAQAWLSGTGSNWRLVQRFDRPDAATSSIDRAIYRDGQIVALGEVDGAIGSWTANEVSAWKYHGIIEEMDPAEHLVSGPKHLVSGPEIMAVATTFDGRSIAWTSHNGVDWVELGTLQDLDGMVVAGFAADGDHYYAFGQHGCAAAPCGPFILRSGDGVTWESVGVDLLPDAREGMITDMVATKEAVLAVGWGRAGDESATYVWKSRNGRDWHELPGAAEQIRDIRVSIAVEATGLQPSPWAQLLVDDTAVDATIGSTLETDTGQMKVTGITADSVVLAGQDGRSDGIAVGESLRLEARPDPSHIAAEGPRIVVSGYSIGTLGTVETTWLSVDGGTTWAAQHFPEIYGDIDAITAGSSIVVYGEVGGAPAVWRNAWDTAAAGDLAESLVTTYINALNGDIDTLLSVLPRWDEGSRPPQLAVPTLSGFQPDWWDTETGDLVPAQIADTLDYLAATEASIGLQECVPVVSLGVLDRVSVRCDYTADSALLTIFGLEGQTGKINAVIRNGSLSTLELDAAPSTPLWRVMANVTDLSAHRNAALGAVHLATAEQTLSQVLHPGATRVVDTVLGTMEWTWQDAPDLGAATYINSLTWSDLGFIAVAYAEGDVIPSPTIWNSSDGREWTELPAPDEAEGLWELQPFSGGLLGQAWFDGSSRLVFFDGSTWQVVEIDPPATALHQDYNEIVVSGDRALVITTWWGEQGEAAREAAVITQDLTAAAAQLPEQLRSFDEGMFNLTGSETGFLITVGGYYGSADDLSVWSSADGTAWRLLAQSSSLDDAQYVWNLEQHRSQYFVVGETLEMRCSSLEEGQNCMNVTGLWSSIDGIEWDRVRTETGEPMATHSIGSGPMGLVAFGQEYDASTYPRPVYLSVDGVTWTVAGGLSLLDTHAEWWWSSTPAVGIDTVLAAGNSYSAGGGIDTTRPFVIIGRVIDD